MDLANTPTTLAALKRYLTRGTRLEGQFRRTPSGAPTTASAPFAVTVREVTSAAVSLAPNPRTPSDPDSTMLHRYDRADRYEFATTGFTVLGGDGAPILTYHYR